MIVDADMKGSFRTSQNDNRITKCGRIIRKTSIDELPQLFNVLKGDMSLVGPRPYLPRQYIDFTPFDWNKRHEVRPGITGLAQIRGRSNSPQKERTRNDLEYVCDHSLVNDMIIICKTVFQIISNRGCSN